jgi:hypothetical protein
MVFHFLHFSFIFFLKTNFFFFKQIKKECGIKVEERKSFVDSGCCHNSIKEIFSNLSEISLLSEILLQFDTRDVEQWKNNRSKYHNFVGRQNAKEFWLISHLLLSKKSTGLSFNVPAK